MSRNNLIHTKYDLTEKDNQALADAVISPMFTEALYKVDSMSDLIDLVNYHFKFRFDQLRALKARYIAYIQAQLADIGKIKQPTTNGSEPFMSQSTDRILSFATFIIGTVGIIAMLVIKSGTV